MSAEEVKILHEAIKLDRMSAEVWAWFTPEEWEMIDSLFALWTTEDVNEELPVAAPQRRLERSLEQSSTEASDPPTSARMTHDAEMYTEIERFLRGFDLTFDSIYALAPSASDVQEWTEPQRRSKVSTCQPSSQASVSSTPAPVTPLDDFYTPAAEYGEVQDFESSLFEVPSVPLPEPSAERNAKKRRLSIYSAAASSIYEDDEKAQGPSQNHIGASSSTTKTPIISGPTASRYRHDETHGFYHTNRPRASSEYVPAEVMRMRGEGAGKILSPDLHSANPFLVYPLPPQVYTPPVAPMYTEHLLYPNVVRQPVLFSSVPRETNAIPDEA